MQQIIDFIKQNTGTTSDAIAWAMLIVGALIIVFALIGVGISIFLFFKYHKLNKTKNSCGLTGEEAARRILDNNGLQHIAVKCTGSIIWGNSYSHYFKKVRLRRFTYKKDSVTSLAMAAEKSALAVLDKEHDPLMKTRNVLIPLQIFGPLMFIPLIAIGVLWVSNRGTGSNFPSPWTRASMLWKYPETVWNRPIVTGTNWLYPPIRKFVKVTA